MEDQRFDLLARTVAASHTRRKTFAFLASFALTGGRPWRARAAQGETGCDVGLTYCDAADACVDLQSDVNHCGSCGAVCESGLVPVDCRSGVCERANCPVGVEYCGIADGCRDLATDSAHCGACANACESGVCTDGVCAPSGGACLEGEVECEGVCVSTCCNNEHCGACGNACLPPFTCFEAVCECPRGVCSADGEVVCNGACVATCCDNSNCGTCGNVCAGGLTCFEGKCDCPSGNCPPVTLPNTGIGASGADPHGASLPAWAAAGAAALAAIGWRRASSRTERSTEA